MPSVVAALSPEFYIFVLAWILPLYRVQLVSHSCAHLSGSIVWVDFLFGRFPEAVSSPSKSSVPNQPQSHFPYFTISKFRQCCRKHLLNLVTIFALTISDPESPTVSYLIDQISVPPHHRQDKSRN